MIQLLIPDEAEVGLVNETRGVERLAGLLVRHQHRGQFFRPSSYTSGNNSTAAYRPPQWAAP